jgi:hypothetical protein
MAEYSSFNIIRKEADAVLWKGNIRIHYISHTAQPILAKLIVILIYSAAGVPNGFHLICSNADFLRYIH